MQDKIFVLQEAVFGSLEEIFKDELGVYLTRNEAMPQKYILIEKITEELEGNSRYSKLTARLLIFTGIRQNFLLSFIITKIKSELSLYMMQNRIKNEIISFYIAESLLSLNMKGHFEGALTLACFF